MIISTRFTIFRRVIPLFWVCASIMSGQIGTVNPSHSFSSDQCGPVDPAYIRTANATGGIPLFLQRSEAAKAMQLMRESSRENEATVLWASAKLTDGIQSFKIPVDSGVERATFTLSVDTKGTSLILTNPNGQIIEGRAAGTDDTNLNCGRIITIEKPVAGTWLATVNGSGTYWLETQVKSDIYFIKAEFVEERGRPGHQGLFRIQGQPVADKLATLQISMSAQEARTTNFTFVSERGSPLQQLHLEPASNDREFLGFTGKVILPAAPFRIAVTGRDVNGNDYQRFDAPLFHAESVEVIPKLDFDEVAPGESRVAIFEVRNAGASRHFKVQATDARRFITGVDPQELELAMNETALVRVSLTVGLTATGNTADDLVILAKSTSGETTANSAVVHLLVNGLVNGAQAAH